MLQLIIYALIQALTEYLPVSSSGHLALLAYFFSFPDLFVFTALHFASLIAVLIFFRKEILNIFSFKTEASKKEMLYIFIGILPAGLLGFFYNDIIEKMFSSLWVICGAYFFTACILLATKFISQSKGEMSLKKSFIIGIAQMAALLPGVSRSGITISTGMFLGLKREKAMTFSFMMYIPLAFAAFLKELLDIGVSQVSPSFLLPFFLCILFSFLALKLLTYILKKALFWVFGLYCFLISLFICVVKLNSF